ncbi:hypothetical protein A2334_03150 [Candidatus Roizmanbacteria bacterium RIFOXYB2_FULL_38_10]|uniref:Uncharacterized protein n=1 Tax=Candidatus Roizmanbacteria bacterium RIFOXYD1_FULL_38_12 TaxID=1802093 RepID=A0A1F7L147_9BACT|nr:MAG: hypothetical protein A3K47_03695 [Candidatus Roizmanbacteria bacterium RIFOXYA2_FULL_38_14]OGK63862.1 MAG: hypothetical protein A3K27_03695 [Candidatus Roizmanbacteria bacterium RIFOXYA1_FULL_37_12]OGK65708.1 MAG: hypothetical protein A3K38_03695 [Candidatus Roizmanbacteria bacterium RIFOXYB1_FULL_40_23]OGK67406.1 MAG: hypothetical protein A2334_03150 [Candidatus Roizmanbacteria bacterium RIFOXYB2_FULL_38_10]OGK70113.1 MAG: hypothetical protein A3K21_03700 [Candidatus Roizmanbacteria ba
MDQKEQLPPIVQGHSPQGPERQRSVLEEIRCLRHAYSDQIPKDIVHSNGDNPYTKARRGWWTALIGNLQLAMRTGEVQDETLIDLIKRFSAWYTNPQHLSSKALTTADDIRHANAMITMVLGEKDEVKKKEALQALSFLFDENE